MDITTNYDSLKHQLRISSGTTGNASGSSDASTSTTADSANSVKSKSDSASWSSLAKSLAGADSEYVSPILKFKAQNKALQEQLTKTLAAKLTDLGVDLSQPVTLGRDDGGNVVVQGEHPSKEKIEKLFKDTPVLTEAFNTLAENSTIQRSMTSRQATSMVRTNGYAAYLKQLSSDSASGDFYMSLLGRDSTTYFR